MCTQSLHMSARWTLCAIGGTVTGFNATTPGNDDGHDLPCYGDASAPAATVATGDKRASEERGEYRTDQGRHAEVE